MIWGRQPIYVHRQSRTLSEILVELLRASNNYIANQVFLGDRRAPPGRASQPQEVAPGAMLAAHGLAAAIHPEEGSGIRRNNPRPRQLLVLSMSPRTPSLFEFKCPHCGAFYEMAIRLHSQRDYHTAICSYCGDVMTEWHGKGRHYRRKRRPPDAAQFAKNIAALAGQANKAKRPDRAPRARPIGTKHPTARRRTRRISE